MGMKLLLLAACCVAAPGGATVIASDAYGTSSTVAAGGVAGAAVVAGRVAGQGSTGYDVSGGVASVNQNAALTANATAAASQALTTGVVTTRAQSPDGNGGGASATVNNLSLGTTNRLLGLLATNGLLSIGADTITSTSDAAVDANGLVTTTGNTLISGLSLGGSLLSGLTGGAVNAGVNYAPAANTVLLSLAGLVVTLNEQIRTQTADGASLVTNGLHLAFTNYALNGGLVNGDVVVARSAVAVNAAPINAAPVSGVPEPASWATMLAGFGVAGTALRRARRAAARPRPARA